MFNVFSRQQSLWSSYSSASYSPSSSAFAHHDHMGSHDDMMAPKMLALSDMIQLALVADVCINPPPMKWFLLRNLEPHPIISVKLSQHRMHCSTKAVHQRNCQWTLFLHFWVVTRRSQREFVGLWQGHKVCNPEHFPGLEIEHNM